MKINKIKKRIRHKLKKCEFAKLIAAITVFILFILALYSVIDYHSLQRLAITSGSEMPVAEVTIECIRGIIGTILIYCGYQFGLKSSRNKYGVDKNGIPYMERIRELYEEMKSNHDEENTDIIENEDDFNG